MDETSVTKKYLDFTRRASPAAPLGAALGARSAVWAQLSPGVFEDRMIRPWVKVIWSLGGEGAVRVASRVYRVGPGEIAVFLPGMRHEAWAAGNAETGPWEVRWVTMDGPLCASIAQAVGVSRAGVYPSVGDLRIILDRYRQGVALATPEGARTSELAAFELLARIGAGAMQGMPADPVVNEALSLLRLHWPDARFGIAQIARQIQVHRSVLSRRFRAQVGVPPLQHLMDLRMANALMLLRSTELSVREVAFQCGFADPGYFIRLFRRTQRITPGQYRAARD